MTAHVTTVTSRTYRLPMPRPCGPEVTCQYLIATTVGSCGPSSFQAGALAVGAEKLQPSWLMAGWVLRPLRQMTAAARAISEDNLHERLALAGPGDELKELGDTIDTLLERLQAAFDAQRNFVASASHELRTPLTVERAMLEVVLADPHASAAALR